MAELTALERDRLLKRFNQRLSQVTSAPEPPLDTLERYLGALPPSQALSVSEKEEFRSNSLRSAVERVFLALAACYAPLFRHLGDISSWHNPVRTTSWGTVRCLPASNEPG